MQEVIAIGKFSTLILAFTFLLSYFVWLTNREIPGVKDWVISSFAMFLYGPVITYNTISLDAGNTPHSLLLFVLPNLLLTIGSYHIALGFCRFLGFFPQLARFRWGYYLLMAALFLLATYIVDSRLLRMIFMRSAMIASFITVGYTLLQPSAQAYRLGKYMGISVCGVSSIMLLLAFLGDHASGLPFNGNNLFLLMALINTVCAQHLMTFCYALMCIERKNQQLNHIAQIDPLTKTLNRRGWEAATENCSKNSKNALIVFDLDRFKQLNDQYGHAAGDEALKAVAALTSRQLPASAALGRLGGEEFAIYLPEQDLSDAIALADQLRKAIEQQSILFEQHCLSLTASFGIFCDDAVVDMKRMMQNADEASYQAKLNGRNRVEIYQPESAQLQQQMA